MGFQAESAGVRCDMNWTDIVALVFSAIAAVFSIWSFFLERNRVRREATIHAFEELEKEVFLQNDYTTLPLRAKREVEEHKFGVAWRRGTKLLSRIEHFCVGVQAKAFDLDTLNRLAGGYFINQYENWKPIIEQKRLDDHSMNHYNEFEDVVNKLKKKRKPD
jgi:hypothetical protein